MSHSLDTQLVQDQHAPEPALVAVGGLTLGAAVATVHTGRVDIVLEQYDESTLVELDTQRGGFEEKCLARAIQVRPHEVPP